MPKKWSEVASSPGYLALPPDRQEAARNAYFDQVVAPRVSPDKLQVVRQQFDQQTSTSKQDSFTPSDASGNVGTARTTTPLDEMGDGSPNALERFGRGVKGQLYDPWERLGQSIVQGKDVYAPGEEGFVANSKRVGGAALDVLGGPISVAAVVPMGIKAGATNLARAAGVQGGVEALKLPQAAQWVNEKIGEGVSKASELSPLLGAAASIPAASLGTLAELIPALAGEAALIKGVKKFNAGTPEAAASAAEKLAAVEANLKQAPSPAEILTALKQATGRSDLKKWTMGKDSVDVMEAGVRPPSFDEMGVPAVTKKGAVLPREVVDRRQIQHLNDLLDLAAQEEPAATQPSAAEASALLEGRMPDEAPFPVPPPEVQAAMARGPEPVQVRQLAPEGAPKAPQNVPVRPLEPQIRTASTEGHALDGAPQDVVPPEMLEAPVKPAPAAPEAQIQAPVKPAGSQAYSPTEATVSTPKGSKYPIKYKVVEADDLVTSHNPATFSEDVRYPKGVQERDYLRDPAEQAKVVLNSDPNKFQPQRVLSDIDTAEAGPPIVTADNIAMGGNGRGMMIKRVYESPNPGALREATLAKAKALGVEGAEGMRKPVLVREMQSVPTEPQALAQLSRELNAEFTGGKGSTAETVSAGRALSPESRSVIAAVISDYDTIAEAMKSKANATRVMDALVNDGIVNQSKISEFMEEGVMTERGAARLRDTLVGSVIDDHAALTALPDSAKQNLAKNIVQIAAIQGAPGEWNVTPMLKDAAKLMSDARRSGMTVDEFLRQGDLLGSVSTDVPAVIAIAKLLTSSKPTEFKKAMRLYASELPQDGGLGFMQKDFRTAFKEAFGVDAPEAGTPLVDPTADAIKRIQNGEAGSVNPIGVIIGAVDKVRKAGEVAFAESRPATLDFLPQGYTKGGKAVMGQIKGKPLDSKLLPKSVLPLNAVLPEVFHFLNPIERLKQGFAKESLGQWDTILDSAGADNNPFVGATPEMVAVKKAIRRIPDGVNTRLTNAEAFFLAMDGKIDPRALPPKMQASLPIAKQAYRAVAKSMGVPEAYLRDNYITHVIDVPESLREVLADKEAQAQGITTDDGYTVRDPYLKERAGVAGYSLDPRKAFRAYVRQATRKMFDEPALERLDAYKLDIPNTPENAWKLKRLDYLTRTLKGGQGDSWVAADLALKSLTPKVLESAFAKMDKTQTAQWLRDRGFGYLEDKLPSSGTTKNIHRALSKSVYTALLGQAWNTAFWNLMQGGNTAALTGYRNAAKGYAAFTADALMSRLDPTYKSKVGSLGKVKEIQNIADGASELSNSSDFTKMVERLNMAPQALTETINRGAAVFSGLQKAQKLVDAGVLPNDPQAMLQYASGIEAITQFEYGPVNTAPVFDVPVVQLAKVLGTYPQQQALFMRHLWTSPAQKKIMGVPAGVWRAALFMGVVYGTGKAAGLNVGEKVGIKEDREGKLNPLTFIPGVGAASDVPGLSGLLGHAGVGRGEWAGTTPFIQGAKGLAGLGQPGLEGKKAPTQVRNLAELLAAGSVDIPLRALNQGSDLLREMQTGRAQEPRKNLIQLPWEKQVRKNTYRIDPAESVAKYLSSQPEVQKKYQDKKRKNR